MLIMIEGIDGAGKSSVMTEIFKKRISLPKPCIFLSTPGGGVPEIRDILMNPAKGVSPLAEPFLFFSEMIHLSEKIINPLRGSFYIFCDRFFLSTFVYQYCCKTDLLTTSQQETMRKLIFSFLPTFDHTIILTVDEQIGMERSKSFQEFKCGKDNFESADCYEWANRNRFYEMAHQSMIAEKLGSITKIDTTDISPEEVRHKIFNVIGD